MKRLHVVGRKNHGKTTLVCDLTERLTQLGHRIGTIKHTHHQHELDTPGKDSHRHRTAGADRAGILSPKLNAIFWSETGPSKNQSSAPPDGDQRYECFGEFYADCDLVIVEGDTQTRADKIEVWRAEVSDSPLARADTTIKLVVSDNDPHVECRCVRRSNLDECLAWIIQAFDLQD